MAYFPMFVQLKKKKCLVIGGGKIALRKIEVLKDFDKQVTAKADGAYQSTIGKMACDTAIKALEEVQQYRTYKKKFKKNLR